MCCLCRPFDDPGQKRVADEIKAMASLFSQIHKAEFEIVNSHPLEWEWNRMKPGMRKDFARAMIDQAAIFVEDTIVAHGRANEYVAMGIQLYDAKHLAYAVEVGANFFYTCDDRLLKRARKVNTESTGVFDPVSLLREIDQ